MSRPSRPALQGGVLNRVYAPAFRSGLYQEAVALLDLADTLGLVTGWVAQHHLGSETGQLPSPLLLLAYASQTIRRLQLGTAVVVLPHEPPLRLAEDAAVLDRLSGGRLQLGLGSGFDPRSYAGFGQDIADRGRLYESRLAELISALSGRPPAGEVEGRVLHPPAPGLLERLWEAGGAVEAVAGRGNGLLVAQRGAGGPDTAALIARYWAAWHGAGAPRVALVRGIFPGRSEAEVLAQIGPDIARYLRDRGEQFDEIELPRHLDRLGVLWGSPARIVDRLSIDGTLSGIDQLVAQVQTFSTGQDEALGRLRLFAERILPALDGARGAGRAA